MPLVALLKNRVKDVPACPQCEKIGIHLKAQRMQISPAFGAAIAPVSRDSQPPMLPGRPLQTTTYSTQQLLLLGKIPTTLTARMQPERQLVAHCANSSSIHPQVVRPEIGRAHV